MFLNTHKGSIKSRMFLRKKGTVSNLQFLLIDLILLLFIFLNIILFWEYQLLSGLIALVIVTIAFVFFHNRKDIIFFAVGAILGTIVEIIAINHGAWGYSNPLDILGIQLYTPAVWGFVFLFGRRLRDIIFKLEHIKAHDTKYLALSNLKWIGIYDLLMYALGVFLLSYLWQDNLQLFILLLLVLLINLTRFHNKADLFFITVIGIVGPILDSTVVSFGAWYYSNPDFFNLPIWAPLAYSFLGLLVRRISITTESYLSR